MPLNPSCLDKKPNFSTHLLHVQRRMTSTHIHHPGKTQPTTTKRNARNGPFATNGHMVQNPSCWRASSLLFPHWDIETKRPQPVKRDWPLFLCPSAGIIMSLPSSMADFVPCDRLLQKAYHCKTLSFIRSKNHPAFVDRCIIFL